jgi:geranylgeranyl diphosphate synthase type II
LLDRVSARARRRWPEARPLRLFIPETVFTAMPTANAPDNPNGEKTAESSFLNHLRGYRDLMIKEMEATVRRRGFHHVLARRLAEYPMRAGKGLRPALCLATCQAYGGAAEEALPSAVALELFHNAFLVHDDIEDESTHRRGEPTMHEKYGTAIAINVGDAMNVLCMTPLMDNLRIIGFEKTLRVFQEIERMAKESVEGQAMELEWVRANAWDLSNRDYMLMTSKKTCWYTCISPCRIGALIAVGARADLANLRRFGYNLGLAFQIQDDLLNLVAEEEVYGKETAGDIWEGKRTLMLTHVVRSCRDSERQRILRTMAKPRRKKTAAEVGFVLKMMHQHGSIDYAREVSKAYARKARNLFSRDFADLPASPHKEFLGEAIDFVIERDL